MLKRQIIVGSAATLVCLGSAQAATTLSCQVLVVGPLQTVQYSSSTPDPHHTSTEVSAGLNWNGGVFEIQVDEQAATVKMKGSEFKMTDDQPTGISFSPKVQAGNDEIYMLYRATGVLVHKALFAGRADLQSADIGVCRRSDDGVLPPKP